MSDHTEIIAQPADISEIIRKKRGRAAFYVRGETPLRIKGSEQDDGAFSYLPLAGNVRVTRRAMLAYLRDIQETAERRKESKGEDVVIRLSVHGDCYFV